MEYLQSRSRVCRTADEFIKALCHSVMIRFILKIDHDLGDVVQRNFKRTQKLIQCLLLI
jgi:hypothetical protein